MIRSLLTLTLCAAPLVAEPTFQQLDFQPLFNGENLDGWDVIIRGQEFGKDPEGMVTVHDSMVHMYENIDADQKVPFGVIMTQESYSQFVLEFEYRWNEKKFAPRKEKLRDAGLLYHCYGPKTIWPPSIECQVQEGDTGDLVFIESSAITWEHNDRGVARPGQGGPGQLPEYGGVSRSFVGGYVGRFPETDNNKGWNTVKAIVHANEYSVHVINGALTSRVMDMRTKQGKVLSSGPIALQLEAAELQYRNIQLAPLDGYLRPSARALTFSRVADMPAQTRAISVTNTSKHHIHVTPRFVGKNVGSFEMIGDDITPLAPGQSRDFAVAFEPDSGAGSYAAGLQFGELETGAFVQISAIATPALEGKNEPSLHHILQSLNIAANVGGSQLALDAKSEKLGDSLAASGFSATGDTVRITPLARYSPPGAVDFGTFAIGSTDQVKVGTLSDSSEQKDAHQSILPPASQDGTFEIAAADLPEHFGLYLAGPHYTSATTQGFDDKAKVPHTARIWSVNAMQNVKLNDAYVVGFEEASNGDYQDVLFLIEGVTAK